MGRKVIGLLQQIRSCAFRFSSPLPLYCSPLQGEGPFLKPAIEPVPAEHGKGALANRRLPKTGAYPTGNQRSSWRRPTGPPPIPQTAPAAAAVQSDRKSTRLNSSHLGISYAV